MLFSLLMQNSTYFIKNEEKGLLGQSDFSVINFNEGIWWIE